MLVVTAGQSGRQLLDDAARGEPFGCQCQFGSEDLLPCESRPVDMDMDPGMPYRRRSAPSPIIGETVRTFGFGPPDRPDIRRNGLDGVVKSRADSSFVQAEFPRKVSKRLAVKHNPLDDGPIR